MTNQHFFKFLYTYKRGIILGDTVQVTRMNNEPEIKMFPKRNKKTLSIRPVMLGRVDTEFYYVDILFEIGSLETLAEVDKMASKSIQIFDNSINQPNEDPIVDIYNLLEKTVSLNDAIKEAFERGEYN